MSFFSSNIGGKGDIQCIVIDQCIAIDHYIAIDGGVKFCHSVVFFGKNRRQRGHFHRKLASPQQNLSLTLEILLWLSSDKIQSGNLFFYCIGGIWQSILLERAY